MNLQISDRQTINKINKVSVTFKTLHEASHSDEKIARRLRYLTTLVYKTIQTIKTHNGKVDVKNRLGSMPTTIKLTNVAQVKNLARTKPIWSLLTLPTLTSGGQGDM